MLVIFILTRMQEALLALMHVFFALGDLHYLLNARSKQALKSKVQIYTMCIRPNTTRAGTVFAQSSQSAVQTR